MEQNDKSPPTTWFHSPITTTRRRKQSIDPVILIILLPILVLLLLLFFLHPFLSYIPKTIKPNSPKSTWDSFIVFIVCFVILCGVCVTTSGDASPTTTSTNPLNSIRPESYEFREKVQVNGRLIRSSRSYPDSRKDFELLRRNDENLLRFSDKFGEDASVNNRSRRGGGGKEGIYRSETISGDIRHRPRRREAEEVPVEGSTKLSRDSPESVIQVRPLSPSAPITPLSVKSSRRRTSRKIGRDEKLDGTSPIDKVPKVSHNPPPSPPPAPPLAPSENQFQQNDNKHDGKLSEITEDLATKKDSVDDQRKRKRKSRQKSRDILPVTPFIESPPPPPPLPPHEDSQFVSVAAPTTMLPPHTSRRSIFNALFKSGGKRKRFPSKTAPSPPPPSSIMTSFFKTGKKNKQVNSSSTDNSTVPVTLKRESKYKSQIKPPSPPSQPKPEARRQRPVGTYNYKPPLPTKTSISYDRDDFLPSSSHSPLIPIPIPSSPDIEPVDFSSATNTIDGKDSFGPSPVSFPSPDVNEKADSFISKRKDEWRMENINLVKKKVGPPPKLINKPKMYI